MTIRTSRFGRGYNPRLMRENSFIETIHPARGFHGGVPAQELEAGFTPEARNFVTKKRSITPRSGLSGYGSVNANAIGGGEVADASDNRYAFFVSTNTLSMRTEGASSWQDLTAGTGGNAPSVNSDSYWQTGGVYDPDDDENLALFVNPNDTPKVVHLAPSRTTFSDFTHPYSIFSNARSIIGFDDRLVFFNVESSASSFPQRVVWSMQGFPRDYEIANGAGFEDLMMMRGEGTKVLAEENTLLFFTEEEIWRGQKRPDEFAFEFTRVSSRLGCPYPQTIAKVQSGVAFLARDLEVYLVAGNEIVPIGPAEQGGESRIQDYLRDNLVDAHRCWATFNEPERRYELYFADSDSGSGYPNRALFFSFEDRSWMPQRFSHEVSYGYAYEDPSSNATNAHTLLSDSTGDVYRLRSDQTTDDGTKIDCRWRSHGMGTRDHMSWDQLYEIWTEHKNGSASSMTIHLSTDLGANFTESIGVDLVASDASRVLAPVFISAPYPQFELRLDDGGTPEIARIQGVLRSSGKFSGGA